MGGRAAAAATAGAARGRGRLTVAEPSLGSGAALAAILRPGTRGGVCAFASFSVPGAGGGAELLGGPARAVDGASWAEGSRWTREAAAAAAAAPPPPLLAVPGRSLRRSSPGRGASPPAVRPTQARGAAASFCVGGGGGGGGRGTRPAGGERRSLARSRTTEPEARQPAAATLPPRGPGSPRAPRRRCRPWSKEEAAAWEEEDGGGQERRQRGEGYFSGSFG